MKNRYILLILCCVFVSVFWAQEPQPYHLLHTNESGTTKKYIARDFISGTPGFNYKAENGNTLNAKIDVTLLFPPTDGTYKFSDGTLSAEPTKKEYLWGMISRTRYGDMVGSIRGQFAVGGSGAATYSIPIECPPGINGMQPNISLVYNSQQGDGIVGWGWSIGGLSMISRAPSTIYYDNSLKKIDWTNASSLSLDGQRLIKVGNEYRTENESFSKITVKNLKSWGPEIIEVQTKDGIIYEYGNPDNIDSYYPIGAGPRFLGWQLSKVYDQFGNFIEYYYSHSEDDDAPVNISIQSIAYGSTAKGRKIIAIIDFVYENKDYTVPTYLDGSPLINNRLLKQILVRDNNDDIHYRKYNLTYNKNIINKYELASVNCYNNDGEKIAPTTIKWGAINSYISVTKIKKTYTGYNAATSEKNWFSADADGDGVSEIIAMYPLNIPIGNLNQKTTRFEVF